MSDARAEFSSIPADPRFVPGDGACVERVEIEPVDPPRHDSAEARVLAFVERHQRGLWRALRAMGCPADVAEELAQDAFLIALDRGVEVEPNAASTLRGIARHLWLRRHRDDARREARIAAAAEELWRADADRDGGDAWLEALQRCLAELPARSRRVLQRVYRDGAGRAELAAELGIGEHGVRSMLQRLRARLRDCVTRRRS